MSNALDELKTRLGELQDIRGTQGVLGWDMETNMPPKGAGIRGNQMSTLARMSHEMMTDKRVGELLNTLKDDQSLSKTDKALVREALRDYEKSVKIPVDLVQEMAKATSEAHHVWINARRDKKFADFVPVLSKIVDLNRRMADCWGYTDSPYDALLDEYEPGLTTAQVDPLFAKLKTHIVPLLQAIQNSPQKPDTAFMSRQYPTEDQLAFSRRVLEDMGFDFDRGRLDLSVHPFTSGAGIDDVRLTTRVHENDVFSALSSSMHEGGHGMYEQGIDHALERTPLGSGTSLGIHESQSRLWENQIGRGKLFWQHFYPQLQGVFKQQLQDVSLSQFYAAINNVKSSFIRVEADEVTYNLHIMLRYEIEKAVIEGSLAVAEIPQAWNEKVQSYLGITPPDDGQGCLQDVHWSHGSFGYFPTYTLGNLYSAQFYAQAKQEISGLEDKIAAGELLPLRNWLNEKIHFVGRSETADEIVNRVCGGPLDASHFVDYLTQKYSEVYALKAGAVG